MPVLIVCIVLTFALFSLVPQLDLAATGVFFQQGQGFLAAQSPLLTAMRKLIWGASILMVLVALAGWVTSLVSARAPLGVCARIWGFILLLYVLGPGILVEWGLKGHWGRARPADVVQFGGQAQFTPPYVISDQCQHNCSFVGGESAGATALAISLWLILTVARPRLPIWAFRFGQALVIAMPLLAGMQRLATGRHFLSDVVLSVLLVALLAAFLAPVLRVSLHGSGEGSR